MAQNITATARKDADAAQVILRQRDRELRAYPAELPDPEQYVYRMPDWMVALLMTAQRRHSILVVTSEVAQRLRPFGLVDYASPNLTAFGSAVWRNLTEGEQ